MRDKSDFPFGPRRVVWELLLHEGDFPTRRFSKAVEDAGLNPADRAFARELLAGILRTQGTLDKIAVAYCSNKLKDDKLITALRIGIYQLLYMDRVPSHAAIDTTLKAVRPEVPAKIKFLNAVLRGVSRGANAGTEEDYAAPHAMVSPAWRFNRRVFSNPAKEPLRYLAETTSYPNFLVKRWVEAAGEEATRARLAAMNTPAALWLRVNTTRATKAEVCEKLTAFGIQIASDDGAQTEPMLRVIPGENRAPLPTWPGFEEGEWAVQDITSFRSLALGAPKPGMRILDLCAAPGGKSFAALEICGGNAEVFACDINNNRLHKVREEAQRLGHDLTIQAIQEDGSDLPEGPWDLILCDVPCSNTGVLNKRAEARWRFSKIELHRLETIQNLFRKKLLTPCVTEQTRILWTTCSLEPEENQEAAARVAKHCKRQLADTVLFEPTFEQAGGFAALLEVIPE
jgi:16S rRNA (cytosine967-C5)-methyltransferase